MMAFTASTPLLTAPHTRTRPRSAACAARPRMSADGVNAGEAYIRELARQSTENARARAAQQTDALNVPPPGWKSRSAYEHGAHNAGEEYMRQLSNNTSSPSPSHPSPPKQKQAPKLTPELQARMAAMRAATSPQADTPARRTIDAAEEARQRILGELKALEKEIDDDADTDDGDSVGSVASLDDEIAAIEAQLAAKSAGAGAVPPPPMSTVMDPPPAVATEGDKSEVEQLRMGMIEMRMEVEKYASEMRKLQEKHEQMMRLIVERYMPGL